MSTPQRHLRLIPFSGTDYSAGEILLEKDGTTTNEPFGISNKLSLLFHFEECAWVAASLPGVTAEPLRCHLSYDQDEAVPTELHLKFLGDVPRDRLSMLKRITVSFEIFRVCYEFTTEVLASDNSANSIVDLVLAVPDSLTTIKHRRLPRIRIDANSRFELPPVTIVQRSSPLTILELGLNSIASEIPQEMAIGDCQLHFGGINGFTVSAESFVRNKKLVFRLNFSAGDIFSAYFELYRQFAYPELRPVTSISKQQRMELYRRTGYFDGFLSRNEGDDERTLAATWETVTSEPSSSNVDFIATDQNGDPAGASSATLAFRDSKNDYWAFHQLCSVRSPDLLTASGHLYSWRADYLAGMPGDLKVVAWFRSESRWLERIYTKFARQSAGSVQVHPIKLIKGHYSRPSTSRPIAPSLDIKSYGLGKSNRSVTVCDNLLAGIGPPLLNASGILDNVTFLDGTDDKVAIETVMDALLTASNRESGVFYVSLPDASETSFQDWKVTPSDRLCLFAKSDLIDFLSSVEHSIAVTRRKVAG